MLQVTRRSTSPISLASIFGPSELSLTAKISAQIAILRNVHRVFRGPTRACILTQEQLRRTSLKNAAKESNKAFKLAAVRYDAGETGPLAVLDAERSLLDTRDSLAVSDGQIVINVIKLYKALGGGWDSTLPEKRKGSTP